MAHAQDTMESDDYVATEFQNNAFLAFPTSKLNLEQQLTGQVLFFTAQTVKQSEKL